MYPLCRSQKTVYTTLFYRRPNMIKLTELMTSENIYIVTNLAAYIFKAFEVRKANTQR